MYNHFNCKSETVFCLDGFMAGSEEFINRLECSPTLCCDKWSAWSSWLIAAQ